MNDNRFSFQGIALHAYFPVEEEDITRSSLIGSQGKWRSIVWRGSPFSFSGIIQATWL